VHEHWTEEAADVALLILSRMKELGKPIIQICGPMSTGGLGDLSQNMKRFQKAIDIATERGLTVFNQIPFQEAIVRLSRPGESDEYCMETLEIFYRRIFESGHISKTLFLSGWDGSTGATWERNLVCKLRIEVEEYPTEWLQI